MSREPVRRRYLVQRGLQGRFILAFCALVLLGAAATALATGIVAHRTLSEAMFRGHLVERSTGDLLLPGLVRVNGIAAMVVALCGLVAAAWLFGREAKALDALCAKLAMWQDMLEREAAGDTASSCRRDLFAAPLPRPQGWAADLHRACCEADRVLRTTYCAAGQDAREVEAAAGRLERALSRGTPEGELAGDLEAIAQRIGRIHAALARYEREGGG